MKYAYFDIIGNEESDVLIVADHASNHIPEDFYNLGLEDKWLGDHIAYDIGTKAVALGLSKALKARCILAGFSRLLVDPNRPLDHETLIPQLSDNIFVPGNANLDDAARAKRIADFHTPYHEAITQELSLMKARSVLPKIISIHSFTPVMNGQTRPWQAAVLWNRDDRLAIATADALESQGDLMVGRNVPYSGKILNYTMDRHAEAHRNPYITLEIRQDLIDSDDGVENWVARLSDILLPILTASAQ